MNYDVGRASCPVLTTAGLDLPSELFAEPPSSLLAFADPGLDSRVAILAPGALDLACLMMRQGYSDITIARCCDRQRLAVADLVIIQAGLVGRIDRAVSCGRSMLAPLGTIAISFAAGMAADLVQTTRRTLLLHGFAAIRVRHVAGETMLRAELPGCRQ